MQAGYLENFIQSGFNALDGVAGKTLVVGGDGRFYNDRAIQTIIKMAAGNGAAKLVVGQNGLLSTPAASAIIRASKSDAGIILSASHNPGGEDGDFGVKFNIANGGPAPEAVTDAIFEHTNTIQSYQLLDADDIDLSAINQSSMGSTVVEVVDSVDTYAELMRTLFDYDAIRALFASGFRMRFDAMHAITGPYAKAVLEGLALLAANAHLAPGYSDGLAGVARSMPTSRAVDRVAKAQGISSYETPTGWKFFGNLLDANKATLCGEESAGTSSNHVREKDGLWAVLLWLNIVAAKKVSVGELMQDHWARFGRDYYSRHDYEGVDKAAAESLMSGLRNRLAELPGTTINGLSVSDADDFSYKDPVDGSKTHQQGIRILFGDSARLVFRLSGTGTVGATLRVYMELFEQDESRHNEQAQVILAPLADAANQLAGIRSTLDRDKPDVMT